jgi:hypothetical protein
MEGRAGDDERPRAARDLAVEHQEGDSAEVIAVQVAHQHVLDPVRVDAGAPHRDQRRRAAVDERAVAVVLEQDARLHAPAAAECVAASEEAHADPAHRGSIRAKLPRLPPPGSAR